MSTLDVLIQKLAGANSSSSSVTEETVEGSIVTATLTDPVFVEKLASAVDFIVDTIDTSQQDAAETSEPKEASVPEEYTQHILEAVKSQKTENISEISGLLRKKLQERALDNEKKAAAGAEATAGKGGADTGHHLHESRLGVDAEAGAALDRRALQAGAPQLGDARLSGNRPPPDHGD